MEAKKVRLALVGLGKMGISHFSIANAHPATEVVVCDAADFLLDGIKKYSKRPAFRDYDEMLASGELDAVIDRDAVAPARADGAQGARPRPPRVLREALLPRLARVRRRWRQRPPTRASSPGRLPLPLRRRVPGDEADRRRRRASATITHVLAEAYGPVVLRPKGSTWRTDRTEGGGLPLRLRRTSDQPPQLVLRPAGTAFRAPS